MTDKKELIDITDRTWSYSDIEYYKEKSGAIDAIINFNNTRTRLRAGILIVKDDEVLLGEEEGQEGEFSLPGGGLEENETPIDAAKREAQEEVFINVKNARDTEYDYCETHTQIMKWVKENIPENKWWYNYYTCLIIAEYDSDYQGKVDKIDKDPHMNGTSRWFKIKNVIDKPTFKKQWKKALIDFGYYKKDFIEEYITCYCAAKNVQEVFNLNNIVWFTEDYNYASTLGEDVRKCYIKIDDSCQIKEENGYKLYGISNKNNALLIESDDKILLEDTRSQLISKSRNADPYKNTKYGKNRFERKKYSKVANQVKQFNNIDMNDLFKRDILTIILPVHGETDEYNVTFKLEGIIKEIAKNIKSNNNIFEYKTVIQSLTKIFNTTDIRVKCECKDFIFRFAHQLIINNNSVDDTSKDPGPGKTGMANTQGKGCKHILLCLANQDWIMKVASVIKNYITYMAEHKQNLFDKFIFPKLYGITIDDAIEKNLVPEDTNLETDKNLIDTINSWAKNRGKIQKGSNKNPVSGKGSIKGPTSEKTENS